MAIEQRMLVVDDEAMIVEEMIEVFDGRGFHCRGATSADEALDLIRADPKIALVVTVLAAGLTYAVTGAIVGFSQRRPLWLVAGVLYIALPCIAVITCAPPIRASSVSISFRLEGCPRCRARCAP